MKFKRTLRGLLTVAVVGAAVTLSVPSPASASGCTTSAYGVSKVNVKGNDLGIEGNGADSCDVALPHGVWVQIYYAPLGGQGAPVGSPGMGAGVTPYVSSTIPAASVCHSGFYYTGAVGGSLFLSASSVAFSSPQDVECVFASVK